MTRKPLVCLLLLACASLLFIPVHGNSPYRETVNPANLPIRIVIMFAFTTNLTQPAMSTTNQSAWTFATASNPPTTVFTFSTGDIDVFNFGFTVYYPTIMNQTVTVHIFQGSLQIEGIKEIPIYGDSFSMTFTVVTSTEPHYPSPQDIFDMWTGKYPTRQDFLVWSQAQTYGLDTINNNQQWMWVMIFGGLTILTAVNLLPKLKVRKAAEPESEESSS